MRLESYQAQLRCRIDNVDTRLHFNAEIRVRMLETSSLRSKVEDQFSKDELQ